jgi:predicted RNA binding protein YcfA (HicA-like mRNA interferase family)
LGKLRVLSGRQVCVILEAHGFIEMRQRGSYLIMQWQGEATTVSVAVPMQDEIKMGTLSSIIHQSHLSRELFEV